MPTAECEIFQTQTFDHKGTTYVVTAFIEPTSPMTIKVDVTQQGVPVAITYPDGLMATLSYQVDLITKFDVENKTGVDAVDDLMKTAENDIRRFL
ncbi:hypothetical protein IHQ71_26680 [Rhizobium sp. TH2]|uniref:hypothetical protein n=1 Tax=Rhizobium sp. TH2 TaxID=2775403 RepID=UPI00215847A5|nr:hypothetical protein [Rhizobium sp. TH2]UVC08672.1 hypothetical protein IHQ71_26680 [Rhizobium sp. TH2]